MEQKRQNKDKDFNKNLKELKKIYLNLKERYSELPSFDELNKDFQIEKLCKTQTDFLIKEIRKIILDKFFDYLKFIESLLNPVTESPLFVFSIIKKIDAPKKESLSEIYKKISSLEFEIIKLDLNYSEDQEVKAVIKYYKLWQEIKKELANTFSLLEKEVEKSNTKNTSYLG
jgi:hypothetical protein